MNYSFQKNSKKKNSEEIGRPDIHPLRGEGGDGYK